MVNKEEFFYQTCAEKVRRGDSTPFLDPKELKQVTSRLKGVPCSVFFPFIDCTCAIIYNEEIPVVCLEIMNFSGTHQDILGVLYHHKLDRHVWGDIIIGEKSYLFVLSSVADYIIDFVTEIGKQKVKWQKVEMDIASSYQPEYQFLQVIVPSLRVDSVLSKLLSKSRSQILEILKDGYFLLNYETQKKPSIILKEGDIFSVRHYGKYQFVSVKGYTKKESLVLNIKKY